MIRGLDDFSYDKRLREMGPFSLQKKKLGGILSMYIHT